MRSRTPWVLRPLVLLLADVRSYKKGSISLFNSEGEKTMKSTFTQKLAAAMTVTAIMASSDAFAQGEGFAVVTDNVTASASNAPNLVTTASYLIGIVLAVTGVAKLKQHVDNPQTPMKDGLARLGAGGALLALPAMLTAMQETIGTAGIVEHTTISPITY